MDLDMLILLNCLASWGNFGTNGEILKDRTRHREERLLESILDELRELNRRLEYGYGTDEHDEE